MLYLFDFLSGRQDGHHHFTDEGEWRHSKVKEQMGQYVTIFSSEMITSRSFDDVGRLILVIFSLPC